MSGGVKSGRAAYNEINITPMLDLAYVLLVIFILMTTASVQGIKVDVPKAGSSQSLAAPKTKAITVNNAGQVFLDAYPMANIADLEARLRSEKAQNPDFPVVVKGEATVQYQKIVEVLDVLRKLEISKVGMVTGRPQAG